MSKLDKALLGLEDVEDPRLLDMPRGVRLLHVEAIIWCAAHRTDGAITRAALRRFTDEPDAGMAAAQLVAGGLWRSTSTGWEVVDVGSLIPSAKARRIEDKNAERWERHEKHRAGDHSECNPKYCTNAVGNAVGNASTTRLDSDRIGSDRFDAPTELVESITAAGVRGAPPPDFEEAKPETLAAFRENAANLFGEKQLRHAADLREREERRAREKRLPPLGDTFPGTGGLREALKAARASSKMEGEGRVVVRPPNQSVDCRDYAKHQAAHRKVGGRWQCEICMATEVPA